MRERNEKRIVAFSDTYCEKLIGLVVFVEPTV